MTTGISLKNKQEKETAYWFLADFGNGLELFKDSKISSRTYFKKNKKKKNKKLAQ